MSEVQFRETVAAAMRRQRLALGLTQADVAAGIDVSEASISNWERGVGTLSAYYHAQLAAYFKAEFALLEKSKSSEQVSA